jgi:hypothetical protein
MTGYPFLLVAVLSDKDFTVKLRIRLQSVSFVNVAIRHRVDILDIVEVFYINETLSRVEVEIGRFIGFFTFF